VPLFLEPLLAAPLFPEVLLDDAPLDDALFVPLLLLLVSCSISYIPLTFDLCKSIGVFIYKTFEDRQEQNLNIQSHRPVFYII